MIGVSDELVLVERGAQRAHAPVHHVARRDGVGARGGLGDGGAGEQLERRVVVDDAVGAQHAAVAVARVLAQAEVGDHQQVGVVGLDRARGELDHALVVPRAGALLVLGRRQAEQQHRGDAERGRLARLAAPRGRSRGGRCPASSGSACGRLLRGPRTSGRRGGARPARSRARGRGCRWWRAGGAGGWRGRPCRDGRADERQRRLGREGVSAGGRAARGTKVPSSAPNVPLELGRRREERSPTYRATLPTRRAPSLPYRAALSVSTRTAAATGARSRRTRASARRGAAAARAARRR